MSKQPVKLLDKSYSTSVADESNYKYSFSEMPVPGEINDMPDLMIKEFIKNPANRAINKKIPITWQRPNDMEYHQYRDITDLNIHAFWEAPFVVLIGVLIGGILTLIIWILVNEKVIITENYSGMWWVLLGGFLTFTWAVVITWGNRNRLAEAWHGMHKNTYHSIRDKIEANPTDYLLNKSRFDGREYYDPDVTRFTIDEYYDRLKSGGFTPIAEDEIEYQKCRNFKERNELMRHISYLGIAKSYLGEIQLKGQKMVI